MKSILAFKEVLSDFSSFTSLQLNLSNSSLIFSAFVSNHLDLLNIMCFVEGSLPIKYLGVSILGRDLHTADCEGLLVQLQGYLVVWRNKTISYGSIVQLSN